METPGKWYGKWRYTGFFEGQGGGPQILRSWGNNFWLNYNQLERRPLTSAWTFRVVELKVECLGCTNSTVKRRETTHCAPVRSLTAPEVIPVKKLMQCLGFEGQLNRKNHDNPQSEVTQTTKLIVWHDFVVLWYPSLTSLAACQSRDIANKHYRYRGINEITMIYICILHTAIIISPTKTWPGSGVQGWRNSWFIGRWWKGTCCRSRCRGFGFSNTRIKPPGEQNLLTPKSRAFLVSSEASTPFFSESCWVWPKTKWPLSQSDTQCAASHLSWAAWLVPREEMSLVIGTKGVVWDGISQVAATVPLHQSRCCLAPGVHCWNRRSCHCGVASMAQLGRQVVTPKKWRWRKLMKVGRLRTKFEDSIWFKGIVVDDPWVVGWNLNWHIRLRLMGAWRKEQRLPVLQIFCQGFQGSSCKDTSSFPTLDCSLPCSEAGDQAASNPRLQPPRSGSGLGCSRRAVIEL